MYNVMYVFTVYISKCLCSVSVSNEFSQNLSTVAIYIHYSRQLVKDGLKVKHVMI